MMKFENCKLVVPLQAQSPMVHFQGEENGATLRGSELKPKLDRFLEKKLELGDAAYIDRGKQALNYKVTVVGAPNGSMCQFATRKDKRFAILYGDRNDKKLVLRDAELTILCMNKELQKAIEEYIVEFFAVTNFGYMQNKGFGSFMPKEYLETGNPNEKCKEVAEWLKTKCEAKACYYMDFGKQPTNRQCVESYDFYFKEIKDFYDLLKSGRNHGGYARSYIYQYMNKKQIHNEKVWMKAKGLAPALKTCNEKRVQCEVENPGQYDDAKYVRALLGLGSKVEFINSVGDKAPLEKVTVKIEHVPAAGQLKIERLDSPLFFKIIQNYVFICAKRIPDGIYGETFQFFSNIPKPHDNVQIAVNKTKELEIEVPDQITLNEVQFSIDDLLGEYVNYYNGVTLRNTIPALKKNREVKKA